MISLSAPGVVEQLAPSRIDMLGATLMRTEPLSEARSALAVGPFAAWPHPRSTRAALAGLLGVQATLFLWVTQRSFFFQDDFNYFKLAQERSFLRYLLTPILGVYPAPGDRLASYLLQQLAPMNFTVARGFLLFVLAAATFVVWLIVRSFARSDAWWTVALVVPFALSLTLVLPVAWWSAGLPIIPGLLFTAVAIGAWTKSYDSRHAGRWVAIAVLAVAAAGAFYIKFLLVPVYLLLLRFIVIPRLLDRPAGIRALWQERTRWILVAIPPAAYLAVFILSGIAARSVTGGSTPFARFFATAWFRAFVPAAFLNARVEPETPLALAWLLVGGSQLLLLVAVVATSVRSPLALRGWALLVAVFLLNIGTVAIDRLAAFGIDDIAYALRYYPEIVLFLPLALALGLRQGAERHPRVAWERTSFGQAVIGLYACAYAASFVLWGPAIVGASPGPDARDWYESLRSDIATLAADGRVVRIVDSETPPFVMETWMAPLDRVSTVLSVAGVAVEYNRASEPYYVVRPDGHLARATFEAITTLLSAGRPGDGVTIVGAGSDRGHGACVSGGRRLVIRRAAAVDGQRLAAKLSYSRFEQGTGELMVGAGDPDRRLRHLPLRPSAGAAEVLDLATADLRHLTVVPSDGDAVCIWRLEVGTLGAAAP